MPYIAEYRMRILLQIANRFLRKAIFILNKQTRSNTALNYINLIQTKTTTQQSKKESLPSTARHFSSAMSYPLKYSATNALRPWPGSRIPSTYARTYHPLSELHSTAASSKIPAKLV